MKDDSYLVHACLEGPEAGVYYRGESLIRPGKMEVNVKLPNYVEAFSDEFTISLTCIGKPVLLGSSRIYNNSFDVYINESMDTSIEFYWVVFGKRLDINVEPKKNNVTVKGDGPYRYL